MKSISLAALVAASALAQAGVLFDNGSIINGTNGGENISYINAVTNTTFGAGCQVLNNNRVGDNFTTTSPWIVDSLSVFSYQTLAGGSAFSFTSADFEIYSGTDINTATLIWSQTAVPVTNGGIVGYRTTVTTQANRDRRTFRINADVTDVTLPAGNYWLVWKIAGTGASGPWCPQVMQGATVDGDPRPGGNAVQSLNGAVFNPLVTGPVATPLNYDIPFVISGPTVSGTVTLEDFGGTVAGRAITVEFVGGPTINTTLDASGNYSVPAPAIGTTDVRIKASHWLSKLVSGVNVTNAGATGVNVSLLNGDVDGDNEVGPGDFGLLATAFLSVDGDPNWNAEADLDGDGEVGPGDFSVLANNFLSSGD